MRRQIKFVVAVLLYYSGLLHLKRLLNNLTKKRLTVLTFHRVTARPENTGLPTIRISTENFEHLLRFLKKNYRLISLQACIDHFRDGIQFPANSLLVTFDDGYRDVLENALPLLQKYDLPFVIFIPTAVIDEKGSFWWDRVYDQLSQITDKNAVHNRVTDSLTLPFLQKAEKILSLNPEERRPDIFDFIESLQNCNAELRERVLSQLSALDENTPSRRQPATVVSWQQLEEAYDSGVEVGSHTVNHQFLTSVSGEEVRSELTDSRQKLEKHLKCPIESFSYPGGKYNEEISKSVAAAGYSCAFTSDKGINSVQADRYMLKRINISDDNLINAAGKFSAAITAWFLFLN